MNKINQRGNTLAYIALALAALFVGIHLIGSAYTPPKHVAAVKVERSVKQLKDVCEGKSCRRGYAYHNGDDWWVYWVVMDSSNNNISYVNSLPPGGNWAPASTAPTADQITAEQTIYVNETPSGVPSESMTPDQSADINSSNSSDSPAIVEGQSYQSSTTESAAPSESSSSDSSPSDSGSSGGDSGGGGDGGGGGGD